LFFVSDIPGDPDYHMLMVDIDVGIIIPNNGTVRFQGGFIVNDGSFGGEKATNSSPPTYFCWLPF